MTTSTTVRLVGLLVIVGMVAGCGGEEPSETLEPGLYEREGPAYGIISIRVEDHSATITFYSGLTREFYVDGDDPGTRPVDPSYAFDATWRRQGEWAVFRVEEPALDEEIFYLARITPSGLEVFFDGLPAEPSPLAFPEYSPFFAKIHDGAGDTVLPWERLSRLRLRE